MRTLNEILERLYKSLNIKNDADFCRKYGIKKNTLSTWKARNKIPYELIDDIAEKENLSLDWLLHGKNNSQNENITNNQTRLQKAKELLNNIENNHKAAVVNVPFYEDIYASAGAGAYNETITPTNNLTFSTSFLKNMLNILDYTGLHIITAVGDSMQPTILDGDKLFILPLKDHNINDGGVYVISTPFGVLVKRVYIFPVEEKIILHSDNPEVEDEILRDEILQKINIIGRVIGILRNRV